MPVIQSVQVGDVWPEAQPGGDPVLYGGVQLTPTSVFEARSK